MKNTNQSVTCETVVNPDVEAVCGIEGNIREMFYFRFPDGTTKVACATCKDALVTGAKAEKQPYRYATVAAVRALADFRIRFVDDMKVHKGHCSFRLCDRELTPQDDLVVRNGVEQRRICNDCGSALDLIATRAIGELALHTSKKQMLKKVDLPVVEEQAKLMPEKTNIALAAIQKLREQARTHVMASANLFKAQLKPTAVKPAPKAEAPKPQPKAQAPMVEAKPTPRKRAPLPKDLDKSEIVLVTKHKLGIVAFLEACRRTHNTGGDLAREVAKTPRGWSALNGYFDALEAAHQTTTPTAPMPVAEVQAQA